MSNDFQLGDHRSTVDQTGQVVAFGSSVIAGNSASDTTRDMMTRLAAMLGAKEYNYAKGGAQLMWVNDVTNNEFGTLGTILHAWKRPTRAAGVLTSNVSAGATTIPVTPNPSTGSTTGPLFKVDDILHVGSGSTAGTGGEVIRANAVTSTNIDVGGTETTETYTLLRNHLAGEPVYVVPTHYGAGNTLFLLWASQVAPYGSGVWANAQRWHQDALRMALSRLRAAEVYEPDHTALTYAGSWNPTPINGASVSGSTAAQGARNPTAINASVTFNVPNNFPGGTVSFNVASTQGNTGGGVWTFTIDGVSAGTMTQVATPTSPRAKPAYFCQRFTGLTAGRHQIVAQMTTYEANTFFDNFIIEAVDPPIVVLFRPHRFLSYDGMSSIFDHGHIRPTLAAQANPAATSISVNQSPLAASRQLAAGAVPKAGEFLVIDPQPGDVSPQEVRTVTSVTGTGPFTINFSGGGLANTHVVGTRCELGAKDYDVRNVEGVWTAAVRDEFDDYVVLHDMDPYIQKDPRWFNRDFVHLNDEGQAMAAEHIYAQLLAERLIAPRGSSRLSRPVTSPTTRLAFLDGQPVAWWAMPAALSEFPTNTTNNSGYRRVIDLTRYYEARIGCIQTALGASTAKLRIQYSIDLGTSWRYLHRVQSATDVQATSTNWVESTSSTDSMCQLDLTTSVPTNGIKYSSWAPIYPEVIQFQYQDTMLRVVGIGGDGVARPTFTSIWLELR